jgi:hypothetical protein
MNRTTIHADELRAGDVLDDAGRQRRITGVVRHAGGAWPIAFDGTGWGIALGRSPLVVWRY